MTINNLFTIVIRIFCLYVLIVNVISLFTTGVLYIAEGSPYQKGSEFFLAGLLIIPLVLVVIAFAPQIVNLLKLDSGLKALNIDLKEFSNDKVARLSLFLVGIWIMFEAIRNLLYYLFEFITSRIDNNTINPDSRGSYSLILEFIYFGMGYLIIAQHKRIIKLLFSLENPQDQKSIDG